MRRSLCCLLVLGVLVTVGACLRHVDLDPEASRDIHRLALVVRVLGEPSVDLPDTQRPKGKANGDVAHVLGQRVSNFELGERIRSTIQQHLPEHPPFVDVAPSAQVESIFGSLLTEEKPLGPPKFGDLASIGVDGVLYVEMTSWGARTVEGKWQLYLSGYGRLFTVQGDSTVWRAPIDVAVDGATLPPKWGETVSLRSSFGDLCERAGEFVAMDLGGGATEVHHSSSLDQPDIEDKGHPPEQMRPVIPFEFDAGPPPDAGHSHAPKGGPQDAGDTLFPDLPH